MKFVLRKARVEKQFFFRLFRYENATLSSRQVGGQLEHHLIAFSQFLTLN
jgi:hypothetical protein